MSQIVDFVINTADCKGFNGQFNYPIPAGLAIHADSAELVEVILPQTTYIVQTGVNDYFEWKVGAGATQSYQIPAAAYSVSSLLSILGTNTSLTFTYSTDTMKVTVSNASAFTLLFGSGPNAARTCATLLGFLAADTASATSVTGTNVANLFTLSLMLRVIEFGNAVYNSQGQRATYRVPMATSPGMVLRIDKNCTYEQKIMFSNTSSLTQLNFQLITNAGVPVQLNGSNYEIVLRFRRNHSAVLG
jgi:hypothetical protein